MAPRVLSFFEYYLALPIPLTKIDLVAVPDLGAAGMENYGLITFAEEWLLYSISRSSLLAQQRVASVIAHEVAHMWFGNLVTLDWWTEVWLNEGLPTYLSSMCVQHVHPEWDFHHVETFNNILVALRIDGEAESRALRNEDKVTSLAQIESLFAGAAYEKGATMVRMLHQVLGDVAFRDGLRRYLQTFQYGNVNMNDFVHSLQAVSGFAFPLKAIMDTWMLQPGYPVIYVQRNYSDKSVLITQRRYINYKNVEPSTRSGEPLPCWWIPLTTTNPHSRWWDHQSSFAKTTAQPAEPNWFECDNRNVSAASSAITFADKASAKEWSLHNVDMVGLYRVRYDARNWALLIEQLAGTHFWRIGPINRAQLIDDAMSEAW